MAFACLADVVIARSGAYFGFPEISHGLLPAVVSVCARRRLRDAVFERAALTGDTISLEEACRAGCSWCADLTVPMLPSEREK